MSMQKSLKQFAVDQKNNTSFYRSVIEKVAAFMAEKRKKGPLTMGDLEPSQVGFDIEHIFGRAISLQHPFNRTKYESDVSAEYRKLREIVKLKEVKSEKALKLGDLIPGQSPHSDFDGH